MNQRFFARLAGVVALSALATACAGGGSVKNRAGPGERIAILANDNSIEVDPTLAATPVTLPAQELNSGWQQPGGNAAKSMGHLALGGGLARVWAGAIAGGSATKRLAAEPVVADGRLYVMDVESRVHAFDAGTGKRLWTAPFGNVKDDQELLYGGGVSVEGQTLYATNGVGDVGAMQIADGAPIWTKRPGAPMRGAPTLAFGTVYATSQDNQLMALEAGQGELDWTKTAALQLAAVFGVGAPAVGQGTVIVGFSSGDLNAYRYENGRDLWQDTLTRGTVTTSVGVLADVDASPVIDQGRVFAIGGGGRMVSLELTTGQRIWELPVGGGSTPWVAGDWVFVVTDDARMLCLSRTTGRVRWVAQLDRYRGEKPSSGRVFWYGPVLAGGRLMLVSSMGALVGLSPADGSVVERVETKATYSLSPVVANATLYLLDDSGKLSAWRGQGEAAAVPPPAPATASTPGQ